MIPLLQNTAGQHCLIVSEMAQCSSYFNDFKSTVEVNRPAVGSAVDSVFCLVLCIRNEIDGYFVQPVKQLGVVHCALFDV